MSTKCYAGIRFPKTRLADFINYARPEYLLKTEAYAREWAEKVSTKGQSYKECARSHNKMRKAAIKHTKNCWGCKVRVAMRMFQEANESAERRPWANLGCGVKLWVPEGRYILGHPWGESLTEISMPEWVEEYGYWNNTDRLDSVSAREWKRREKAWEGVLGPNSEQRKLTLVGFNAESKYTVDMSWLELRLLRGDAWGDPHGR